MDGDAMRAPGERAQGDVVEVRDGSGRVRSKTISIKRLGIRALERGRVEYPDEGQHAERPRTRGECPPDGSPCPPEQQQDALKELTNVICGNLLPELNGTEPVYFISAPQIVPVETMEQDRPGATASGTAHLYADAGAIDVRLCVNEPITSIFAFGNARCAGPTKSSCPTASRKSGSSPASSHVLNSLRR